MTISTGFPLASITDAGIPFGADTYPAERGYLSRLQALVLDVAGRGTINGSEPVAKLLEALRAAPYGDAAASRFIAKHGKVLSRRANEKPVRLFPRSAYQ